MAEIGLKDIVKVVTQAQKRPENRLILKQSIVLTESRQWPVKDGEKPMFTYVGITSDTSSRIEFNTARVLPIKPLLEAVKAPVEVILVLNGFRAFEFTR